MDVEQAVDKVEDKAVDSSARVQNEAARLAAQKKRSIWLALALLGFVLLIGTTSAFQLKQNIERRAAEAAANPVIIEGQP